MPDRAQCEATVRRLWPYLDGILPDHERERVVRHLEGCEACKSHFDFASEFLRAVHLAGAEDTGYVALERRVLRALEGEGFVLQR